MKQIFDWLREQNGKLIGEVHSPADVVWNNAVNMCISKIDEAEAKWKSEVCEWTFMEGVEDCRCGCNGYHVDYMVATKYNFCPYCGKRIKISEVE